MSLTSKERFWSKVEKRGAFDCWPWTGACDQRGYGQIWLDGSRMKATRFSWSLANNHPFPSGKLACHTCDNPNCVNPRHIWPGTMRENILDAVAKGRVIPAKMAVRNHNAIKTHCQRGHPFDQENTGRRKDGKRFCRTCQKHLKAEWDRARAALRETGGGNG